MADEENDVSSREVVSAFIKSGIVGAVAYGLYRLTEWWRRSEDGPAGKWGVGFGKGNAGVNVNPLDMGTAATGDGEGKLDGEKWERAEVAGVEGWRRRGIPLPNEEGGPETYQAAVLIMGDGDAIPDVSGWPNNLPVFFVHDPSAAYPEVDGGWLIDATFGNREEPGNRSVACKASTSDDLFKCVKTELDTMLPGQWKS
jgi:hypothetical protein